MLHESFYFATNLLVQLSNHPTLSPFLPLRPYSLDHPPSNSSLDRGILSCRTYSPVKAHLMITCSLCAPCESSSSIEKSKASSLNDQHGTVSLLLVVPAKAHLWHMRLSPCDLLNLKQLNSTIDTWSFPSRTPKRQLLPPCNPENRILAFERDYSF